MFQNYISSERVVFFEPNTHKQQALAQLMDLAAASKSVTDAAKFKSDILERENIVSTGIGLGIAVPHTYSDVISDIVITIGISRSGIGDYDAMDDKPVHFIIMVAASSHQHREYLQLLAQISLFGKNEKVRSSLLAAQNAGEVIAALATL